VTPKKTQRKTLTEQPYCFNQARSQKFVIGGVGLMLRLGEKSPLPPEARRSGALGDFYDFLTKITHF